RATALHGSALGQNFARRSGVLDKRGRPNREPFAPLARGAEVNAARLARDLDFIDKVFFVVDRKDLDYQTMKEYQRFSPDSVNGSDSTAGLKRKLGKDDNKIIVTTIQKLNNLMKSEGDLPVYDQQVVFIFDECHRSQFGEAQKNLKKKYKHKLKHS
ncbi:MAG: DEAD/DEAH box helicase family protein, partial [Rivularia sp. ALOHA_DT_140]|nr:DEAD/DEAH box helicase family protein [Rivularia sp. ALOHA_DT_140]